MMRRGEIKKGRTRRRREGGERRVRERRSTSYSKRDREGRKWRKEKKRNMWRDLGKSRLKVEETRVKNGKEMSAKSKEGK